MAEQPTSEPNVGPQPSFRQLQIESYKRSMAHAVQEAAAFREFKSCVGMAKYYETMAKICQYQCKINKLEVEDDALDPELVDALGEEKARAAKLERQEGAVKKLLALRKANKLSEAELLFVIEKSDAAGVSEKELEG